MVGLELVFVHVQGVLLSVKIPLYPFRQGPQVNDFLRQPCLPIAVQLLATVQLGLFNVAAMVAIRFRFESKLPFASVSSANCVNSSVSRSAVVGLTSAGISTVADAVSVSYTVRTHGT